MTFYTASRSLLATSLCLALLAGCTSNPIGTLTQGAGVSTVTKGAATTPAKGATATTPTKAVASTPFLSSTAANLSLTSTSQVSNATGARALAVHDESLVESASAGMESDESKATYSLAAVGAARRPGGAQGGGQGFDMNFEMGRFGGGQFGESEAFARPVIERHAVQPKQPPRLAEEVRVRVEVRIVRAQAERQQFVKKAPKNSEDEAMIRQVLNSQPWQPSEDDDGTVYKSGSSTLTLANGVSRKVAVLRVVEAQRPHGLVKAQTDIADVYADGSTKTVHWEKALQEDGSYNMVYHHEYTDAKGTKWVADWSKTLTAEGRMTGTGTFTQTDADGTVVVSQTLTIGGDDTDGQTISTGDTTTEDTATTEETATEAEETATTTEETATTTEETTADSTETASDEQDS